MLAKTIGVLNLISRNEGLKASEDVLRQLFTTKRAFQEPVQSLLDASVVQYRRFSGEYRVWQGTDFDIDERTDEEKDKLGEFDLAAALSNRAAAAPRACPPPLHSYRFPSLFQRRFHRCPFTKVRPNDE